MTLECLDGSILAQLAHMDAHVRAAGSECVVALPVHVQGRSLKRAVTDEGGPD